MELEVCGGYFAKFQMEAQPFDLYKLLHYNYIRMICDSAGDFEIREIRYRIEKRSHEMVRTKLSV
jgi:hypothetical protein